MTEVQLDPATVAAIRQVMHQVLEERSRIDAETHALHHAAVAEWVKCRQRRSELAMAVSKQVLGIGAVLGLGWLGSLVLRGLVEIVQRVGAGQ